VEKPRQPLSATPLDNYSHCWILSCAAVGCTHFSHRAVGSLCAFGCSEFTTKPRRQGECKPAILSP